MRVENEMIRRREKEFSHQQMWNGADKYFRHWEKANSRFDSWTSPRYYEDNNKLVTDIRNKKDKEELLEKRREKLKKTLEEEDRTYEIELMVHKTKNVNKKSARSNLDDIPTEVLKDINVGLKLEEERKRRHEAEIKLYHQWRKNNPIIRQYESKYRCKDLKLSWLDQQIEKQMQKEKEEQDSKRILKERDERIKRDKERAELCKRELEERKQQLKAILDRQIVELRRKQEISDELKKKEEEDFKIRNQVAEILETHAIEEKRRADRECALYNIRQQRLKLKQRATNIQENLLEEKLLITKLRKLELKDIVADQLKRAEIQEGLAEFLNIVNKQQELEKQRQTHLEFLFDSEARTIYDKQMNMWRQEEMTRKKLLTQVIDAVKTQVEENLEKNKEQQRQILAEREQMAKMVEEYDMELKKLKVEAENKKIDTRKIIEDDVKVKNARKKLQENFRLKEIDKELERIKKEEERLQQEILKIQQRQGPYKPSRSRFLL